MYTKNMSGIFKKEIFLPDLLSYMLSKDFENKIDTFDFQHSDH